MAATREAKNIPKTHNKRSKGGPQSVGKSGNKRRFEAGESDGIGSMKSTKNIKGDHKNRNSRPTSGKRSREHQHGDMKNETKSKRSKKAAGASISQAEHDAVLAELKKVEWGDVVNTSRKNVIPEDAPKCKRGKPFCMSFILGPNMKDPERKPSFWTEQNPELFRLLCELMRKYDPSHKFTNITINKNLKCKAHRDRGNNGMSYIIGFGDYEGGELIVGPRTAKPPADTVLEAKIGRGFVSHSIRKRWLSFYGGEETHYTAPFTGDRYTCVFYNFPEVHVKAQRVKSSHDDDDDNSEEDTKADSKRGVKKPIDNNDEGSAALRSKLEAYKAKLKKKK